MELPRFASHQKIEIALSISENPIAGSFRFNCRVRRGCPIPDARSPPFITIRVQLGRFIPFAITSPRSGPLPPFLPARVETMCSTMCLASRPTPPNSAELSE